MEGFIKMAETKYSFNVTENFPNQKVGINKLSNEIINSSIISNLSFINTQENICDIWFDSELNGIDSTNLDYIVSIHDGIVYENFQCKGLESDNVSSTSSMSYVNRNSFNLENINPGTYKIEWYFEFYIIRNKYGGKVRIQLDDDEILGEININNYKSKQWDSRCGFSFVEFSNNNHYIDLDYAAYKTRYAVSLRNVNIYIHSIETLTKTIHEELNPVIIKKPKK